MEEKQQSDADNGLNASSNADSSRDSCDEEALVPTENGNVLMELEASSQGGDITSESSTTFGRDSDEPRDSFLDEDSDNESGKYNDDMLLLSKLN